MKLIKCILFLFIFFYGVNLFAEEKIETSIEENIRRSLATILPSVEITKISKSPINNLYEVMVGTNVIYMTGDGRYVLKGDLLDMQERTNLSETQRSAARTELFKSIPENEIIEFAPEKTKSAIYVFTDIDCSYCRRLHRDVPVLNENGVAVRYLAYPRAGIGSQAFNDMVSVWCADDRKKALTDAKNGEQIVAKQCENPVEEQYNLGKSIGLRGTPGIFLEDGEEIPGYMPPSELLKYVYK